MYTIGQVIYTVLSKRNQVYPMQVIEVITKKTMQGEEVRYLLQGGSDRSNTIMLDQVDGEVFDTSEKARVTLTKRATQQINKIVDAAVSKASEWYAVAPANVEDDNDSFVDEYEQNADIPKNVVLPDGTTVKVNLPKELV